MPGHRWCADGSVGEPREHSREVVATIESVLELGEVARGMATVQMPVGADQGRLHVAEHRVDPLECRVRRSGAPAAADRGGMRTAVTDHGGETAEPVAVHVGRRREPLLGESADLFAGEAGDGMQHHALRAPFPVGLHRGDERRLALSAAAGLSRPFTSEVGVVNLDALIEPARRLALEHDLRELVLELPRGVVVDVETAHQLHGRDAVLRLRHQVHCAEPRRERQLGTVKDGAGGDGGLPATAGALVEPARRKKRRLGGAALRADETVGPTPLLERAPALLFAAVELCEASFAEPPLELDLVAHHAHLRQVSE